MRYLSVCSGIEAATVAWKPLGWEAAAFSEIEKFPRDLLQHHYPDIPCHGDFTTIGENDYGAIDLLVGGTPCQSFSVAGLRKGFADDRGNLTLAFLQLLKRKRPKWMVWENVPGVLSHDKGRTFGSFLGGLGECGYGFAYRVLDAQYFGVPQRRRRVFVVGCLGDWRSPAQVLFEPESLSGDITPQRKEGQNIAGTLTRGFGARGVDAQQIADGNYAIAKCLTKRGAGGENHCADTANFVTYTLAGNTIGRQPENGSNGIGYSEDVSYTLTKSHSMSVCQLQTVRRLTPLECERLQGFPDGYTKISEKTTDGPRYSSLGNSIAVPVISWLGKRIKLIKSLMEG